VQIDVLVCQSHTVVAFQPWVFTNAAMPHSSELRLTAESLADAFPATTVELSLKQLAVPSMTREQRLVLDYCFPNFASLSAVAKHVVDSWKATRIVTSKGIYDPTVGRARRYAGGADLPQGRYFSLCRDASGDDGGTLCYELMSYWNSMNGVYVGLTDSTTHVEAIAAMGQPDLDNLDGSFLLVSVSELGRLRVDNNGSLGHGADPRCCALPLNLVHMVCDNVLDLRRPAAQDWLVDLCQRELGFGGAGFQHLICTLMAPFPGGNAFHDSLGAWLRAHGCMGLVYPSARIDVAVAASDAEIEDSQGWSFVLYHGAPAPEEARCQLQPPFPWLDGSTIGVHLSGGTDDGLRIWVVRGVVRGEWRRVFYEIRRSRGEAPPPSPVFDPYYESRSLDSPQARFFEPLTP
jgi:hypothetical protein